MGQFTDDQIVRSYAAVRAFAFCVDCSDAPVRDVAELPMSKDDLEVELFFAFNGMRTSVQTADHKRLVVQLGAFLDLSDQDRRSISAVKINSAAKIGVDQRTAAELDKLLLPNVSHYQTVLARALKGMVEMQTKVDAFDQHHNLTGRLNAHS